MIPPRPSRRNAHSHQETTELKPAPFEYHAPTTLAEATQLLHELGDDAKVLAGGQSLIPMLALRLTAFGHLIDIGRIDEIKGVERRNGSLWVGAGTTETAVGSSGDVQSAVPLLHQVTPLIGHFQIRNRGTLGGSIAHADPAAEYPAVALALDAEMEVVSTDGSRRIEAMDFFAGLWTTSMAVDEILVGATFPAWGPRSGFGVEEFARRHGDFAVAGATIGVELDRDGRIQRCAIGLIGVGSTPERPTALEGDLLRRPVEEVDAKEIGRLAMEGLESIPSDLHGSADYRRRVGAVMVTRAWTKAIEEATR
jgi:carbon-monoxide dehydrogenase medium subunit